MKERHKTILCALLIGLMAAALIFVVHQLKLKNNYRSMLEKHYTNALGQTGEALENVGKLLGKVGLAEYPQQNATIFAEIWQQAQSAHTNISLLPYSYEMASEILRYLAQTSHMSYAMLNKSIDGHALTKNDWDNVEELKIQAAYLSHEINGILKQEDFVQINLQTLDKDSVISGWNSEALSGSMAVVYKRFQDSNEVGGNSSPESIKPKMTEGQLEVTKEEAMETVKKVLKGFEIADIKYSGTTDFTVKEGIPAYNYAVTISGEQEPSIWIDISREGAYPLWMINNTDIFSKSELTPEQAVNIGQKFLSDIDYKNMKFNNYEKYENVIYANFTAYQNGIILYPDLIKVKISLLDGTIMGFVAVDYIMMHTERELYTPTITASEAQSHISDRLKVEEIAEAVILLETGEEALCYEFSGLYNSFQYKMYINANTGKLEKIKNI